MQDFFPSQYTQEELQRLAQQQHTQNDPRRGGNSTNMSMSSAQIPTTTQQDQINLNTMADMRNMAGMMPGGDGLDDIMMHNGQRRQSLSVQQGQLPQQYQDTMGNLYNPMDMRRGPEPMIEFGAQGDLSSFQFGGQTQITPPMAQDRRPSGQRDMAAEFAEMAANMNMGSPTDYSGMPSQSMAGMVPGPQYGISQAMPTMMGGIMYSSMGMTGMNDNQSPINPFDPSNYPFSGHPMSMGQDMMMPLGTAAPLHRGSSGILGEIVDEDRIPGVGEDPSTSHSNESRLTLSRSRTHSSHSYPTPPISTNTAPQAQQAGQRYNSPPHTTLSTGMPIIGPPRPPQKSNYQGIYSSSGFDMVGALMRVAARKNPEIDIGAVDMSCAFVVCDVSLPDCPIIYVSEIFERLTGYNKHEILGQNCRFLQSPDGKVQAGIKRRYVDDNVVYALKRRIRKRREVQRTLINYRKGGQAFTNLLTMIPIPWDTDEIRYFVGFQVDLVDKPGAVSGRSASGTYAVNYSQSYLPQYIWHPPDLARARAESGQTISREDVSAVLANYPGNFDSEYTRRVWDRLLLENSDDVIHVLSLKGLFLYVSPSSLHVLEYSAAELIGTALSSVCHPSDIVPVTRELKDASSGQAVSVVYRIRRKVSGYTWFESHGALSVEQGKGRKCIILVGRERPVYTLSINEVEANGGIGDNEIWSKLSTAGMFLFVSSHVRGILDRQAEDLQGTSIQALMRQESKAEFGRVLERARTGKTVSYKHDIMTKRGMFMMAQTTLYPGDAQEGSKPTFFVAQTRLVGKPPRVKNTTSNTHASQHQLTYPVEGSDGKPNSKSDSAFSSTSTLDRPHVITIPGSSGLPLGTQDLLLSSPSNIFLELQTTRCTSWQFELRQMEKANRALAEELAGLLSAKKKRKRRKGVGGVVRSCANCRVRETPEWRRGPSGMRDLCNSCGLRWAKQVSKQGGAQGKDRGGVVGGVSSEGSSSGSGGVVLAGQSANAAQARAVPVSQEG